MRLLTLSAFTFLLLLTNTQSAQAFGVIGSTGLDMQSVGMMILCQDVAEKAVLSAEKTLHHTQCFPEKATIVPYSTKLIGLSEDKNGFVYEMFVESRCDRIARYEVEVGPNANGTRCVPITEPMFLDVE